MTLVHLANFVRIAELRSLSKAAAVIRIAQPALSRQVRRLEAELGAALLVRHAWGVSLTPAGEVLLTHARRMLREADGARDAVQALAAEPRGRVALGVPASLGRVLLPPLAAVTRRKYPSLRLHLVDGFSAALHARMMTGELDLAVLYEDRAIGPLDTTPLLTEDLMLIGPRGASIGSATTAEALRGRPLILPARPNRLRLIVDEMLSDAEPPIAEVDSLAAIFAMVENGEGFTVLPYSTVAKEVDCGDLAALELHRPELSRTLHLARPLARQPTAAVSAVGAEIRSLARELAGRFRWRLLGEEAGPAPPLAGG